MLVHILTQTESVAVATTSFIRILPLTALITTIAMSSPAGSDLEARRKALNDLVQEQWEDTLRYSPVFASIIGDKRYNDQLDDFSQQAIDQHLEHERHFLGRFEAIDTTGFPDQETLNKEIMVRDLRMDLEGARFKPWEMPVDQQSGPHVDLPQLVNVLSFESAKDYEDYIARMRQMPRYFDQTIVHMREGLANSLMPPRILLEKVVPQANEVAGARPDKSPFVAKGLPM